MGFKLSGNVKSVIKNTIKKIPQNHVSLKVGFFEGNSNIDKAIQNEYGNPAKRIPPRPFMQQTIDKYERTWAEVFQTSLIRNDYDGEEALNALGAVIRGQIVNTIYNGNYIPNAPYTVAKKGFNKPLVDTGDMANSVTWGVTK
jgi:hypothetical protein